MRAQAEASAAKQSELWAAYVEETRNELQASGVEVRGVEDSEAFRAAVEPVLAEHGAPWADLVQRIRATE